MPPAMRAPALLATLLFVPAAACAQAPDRARLGRTLDSLATASRGSLGVAIELLETRERIQRDSAGRYPMQSVYKLPIAMATLAAVDAGRLRLDQPVAVTPADFVTAAQHSPVRNGWPRGTTLPLREVLRLNTVQSDGTACDVLLRLLGGPATVDRWLRGLGVPDVMVLNTEKEIGTEHRTQYRNWMSPAGALALLRAAQEGRGLSPASHALLLEDMHATATGAARLRAGIPAQIALAHRTGSSGTHDGLAAATNDIGIVALPDGRHLAIAVLLRDSRLASLEAREAVIAAVARAAWREWSVPVPP
jgi:beta-lactamase class A